MENYFLVSIQALLSRRMSLLSVSRSLVFAGVCFGYTAVGVSGFGAPLLANTNQTSQQAQTDSQLLGNSIDAQLRAIRLSAQQRLTRLRQESQFCSLDECLLIAVRENPGLKASAFEVQQSAYILLAARQSWSPTLTTTGSGLPALRLRQTYSGRNSIPQPYTLSPRRNPNRLDQNFSADLSVQMQWEFLDPMREPSINSELNNLKAQRYVFLTAGRELVYQVQSTYFNLYKSYALLQAYAEILDAQWTTLQQVQGAFEQGIKSKLDVSAIQAQYSQNLNNYLAALTANEQSAAKLASLLSLPTGSAILPDPHSYRPEVWDVSLADSLESGLENNELIKSSLSSAMQQRWQGIRTLNSLLPSFGILLGGTWASSDSFERLQIREWNAGSQSRPQSTQSNYSWQSNTDVSASLNFKWLLFDGGQARSNANASFSSQQQYLATAANQKNEVSADIRSQFEKYQIAKLSVATSTLEKESAYVALQAARERYSVGFANITTLITQIQDYSRAVIRLQESINTRDLTVAELQKSTAQWPNQAVEKLTLSLIY